MPANTDPTNIPLSNDPTNVVNFRPRLGLTIRRPKNNNRNNNRNNNTRNRRRRNNVPNLSNQPVATPIVNNGVVPNFNPGIQYFTVLTPTLSSYIWSPVGYGKKGTAIKTISQYAQELAPTKVLILTVQKQTESSDGAALFSVLRMQKYDVSSQSKENIEVRNATGKPKKPIGTFIIAGKDMQKFKFYTSFKKTTAYIDSVLSTTMHPQILNRPMLQNQ
jgi:hypothetical protein